MKALILVILALCLCGCATRFGADNTASGGGSFLFQTWRCDPAAEPIGGNAGNTGNTTTRGGSVDADTP